MKRLTKKLQLILLLLVTVVAAALNSCRKSGYYDGRNVSSQSLAAALANSRAIEISTTTTGSYAVVTSSGVVVTRVNVSGIYIVNAYPAGAKVDSATFASLPASIGTYLTANYAGYAFTKAYKVTLNNTVDSYVVVISFNGKPVALKFDASGTFVKVFEQREGPDLTGAGWHIGGLFSFRGGLFSDTVAVKALPTAVKGYFTTSYPKDTLLNASVNFAGDYIVISKDNGFFVTVVTPTGTLITRIQLYPHLVTHVAVAQSALPAKVATYLSTTYPAYTFNGAYAENLNGVLQGYFVFIDANNTRLAIQFDAGGTFVKVYVIR